MNTNIKSSDIVGIRPVLAWLPGSGWRMLGVFCAVEVKTPGWKFNTNDQRANAQKKFLDIVKISGGLAGFATGPDDIEKIISL